MPTLSTSRPLRRLGKLLLAALAVYLVWRLLADVDWAALDAQLARAHRGWILGAIAVLGLRMAIWAWRWSLAVWFLRDPVSFPRLLSALAAAAAVNQLTPGARVVGGFLRARWVHRFGDETLGKAFGGVLYDQIAHQMVVVPVTIASLVAGAALAGRTTTAWVLGGLAVVLVAAALEALRRRGAWGLAWLAEFLALRASRADGRFGRALGHTRGAVESVRTLAASAPLWGRTVALGVAFTVANVFAQWATFRAVGIDPGWPAVVVVVTLGTAAGALLGTPGGAGATEATMIACYAAFGIDRLDATAATLLYRAVHYAVLLVPGLICLALLELRKTDRPVTSS